jgi:uncharacterized protein YndB with AHSA1/START domain
MTVSPPAQLASDNNQMIVAADLPHLSPETAFDCFTQPELLSRWWPPEADVEAWTGGRYRLTWPAMGWELSGRYITFEPGERLGFSWQWAHRPELPARTVIVEFVPVGAGCRLTVTHSTYGEAAIEQEDRQSHVDGWIHFLGRLQKLA